MVVEKRRWEEVADEVRLGYIFSLRGLVGRSMKAKMEE